MSGDPQHGSDAIDKAVHVAEQLRLTHLWGRRGLRQVRIRRFVAPLIVVSALIARAIGFEFPFVPVVLVGVGVFAYNLAFIWLARRQSGALGAGSRFDRLLTTLGMLADYAALLLLLHFTGGVSSPILPFLIFHVITAAIEYRPRFSLQIAAAGASGVWLLLLAQLLGWWPAVELSFRGTPAHALDRPAYLVSVLLFFTVTLFLSAVMAGRIMLRFRERVAELVEERTRFMLLTAHNLRAPLGAGLSMLDLVRDGDVGPVTPEQQSLLTKIGVRLRSLHQTIGELLTIAKTRDWSKQITDVVVDLGELARRTEETFRELAAAKRIRFTVSIDEGLPRIDSGANLLDQLMENLVSNAIKYTPEQGAVTVRFTQLVPEEIRIVVEDDGIGIPTGEQDRLFQEYFRASNAKRATADGTGLGLVLVKKTVERHRGRISLASDPGSGTTIVVDLPVRQPQPNR